MGEFPKGYFFILNVFSGKVLDVNDNSTKPGTEVVIWHRKAEENDSQLWKYDKGFLINKNSDLVLEVPGYENGGDVKPGTILRQAERRGENGFLNQVWAYSHQNLTPYDPDVCIAVEGDNVTTSGTNAVAAARASGDAKQHWYFEVA